MASMLPSAGDLGTTDARAIRGEVLSNGVAMFQASTSDNGSPNVDEVWNYLPELEFQPTQAYLKPLKGHPLGSMVSLEGENNERSIELSISYGGRAWIRSLTLEHKDGAWRIAAEKVKKEAPYRWIRRSAVKDLRQTKPKK